MMKQMDTRGKVINCAFAVSAAFTLATLPGSPLQHQCHDLPNNQQVDRRRNGDWRGDDAGAKRRRDRS